MGHKRVVQVWIGYIVKMYPIFFMQNVFM